MPTLNYQPTLQDPRIHAATIHLLIWTIFNYILAGISACILLAAISALFWFLLHANFSDAESELLWLFSLLGLLGVSTLANLFFFKSAEACRIFRKRALAQEWTAFTQAHRQTVFALFIATIPFLLNLAATAFAQYKDGSLMFIPTLIASLFNSIPLLAVLWTRRVLRRAHDAASVSNQSPLTFS